MDKEHRNKVNEILAAVSRVNPHTNDEGRIGYVWSTGFLASVLASILKEDPSLRRKFHSQIEAVRRGKR